MSGLSHRVAAVLSGGGASPLPPPPPPTPATLPGVTAYWPMAEASGDRVDAVNGAVLAATTTVGSLLTAAGPFVATNRLQIADSALVQNNTGVMLFAFRFRMTNVLGTSVAFSREAGGFDYDCLISAGSIGLRVWTTTSNYTAQKAIAINTWYSVVVAYTGSAVTIDINDGTPLSTATAGTALNRSSAFAVGNQVGGGFPFPGLIGDLVIARSVWSDADKQVYFTATPTHS